MASDARKGAKRVMNDRQQRTILIVCAAVVVTIFSYVFIWRTQHVLDTYLETDGHFLFQTSADKLIRPSPIPPFKFLMVEPVQNGQGIGNIMNGLLAAHLLAEEFGRAICISDLWVDFYAAFVPLHHREECAKLPQHRKGSKETITLLNFEEAPNECNLRDKLGSNAKVLFFVGNTYPRWRTTPDKYWDRFYAPTDGLKSKLTWKRPVETVVHLRQADGDQDARQGLDDKTLEALGKNLPSTTFLVTNNVLWYTYFKDKFQWSNPGWSKVRHSAFENLEWGPKLVNIKTKDETMMDLWCDWYTILKAKRVIHTHSDFSLSAIHWRNIDSNTIQGVDENGRLVLVDEPWRREESITPLVDRNETELKRCDPVDAPLDVDDDSLHFD
jgi:hypothetical protein